MKHLFGRITLPPLMIAVLLLTAAILLACGPVTQSEPQAQPTAQTVAQDSDPDPTPTPTPTPTPEPPKYPNLDTLLQGLVAKYEAGALSETAAAVRAPVYHENRVFVDIRFSTDAEAVARWREETGLTHIWPYVDETEGWLAENQSGALVRPVPFKKPFIYAYVPISKLGPLSQREGVTSVAALQDQDGSFAESQGPGGASGGASTDSGDETSHPFHPEWMYPLDPYAQIGGKLGELAYRYDQGELTAEQVVAEFGRGSGTSVDINMEVNAANANAIAAWLRSNGGNIRKVIDMGPVLTGIIGDVPVSKLSNLIQQPGVISLWDDIAPRPAVRTPVPSSHLTPGHRSNAQETRDETLPLPTPTPGIYTSEGVAAHGVTPWKTALYEGKGIKIGIIDSGFDNLRNLMGTELPLAYQVESQCYVVTRDSAGNVTGVSTTFSDRLSDCEGSWHGTMVAEAIVDVAPKVSLYLSNAMAQTNTMDTRLQMRAAVDWMIREGVHIINHSFRWPYSQGLGDGVVQYGENDVLDMVQDAVDAGILWVNGAGNENGKTWRGALSGTIDSDGIKNIDFTSGDNQNYITFNGSDRKVTAELRWETPWKGTNCDLNLMLYRENPRGTDYLVASGSLTQTRYFTTNPYEWIDGFDATVSGRYYLQVRHRFPRTAHRCAGVEWVQLLLYEPHTLEHTTTGYSIGYPAESKSPGLLAVGAAKHSTTSTIQSYSSRGPTNGTSFTINGSTVVTPERKKPELVGADCGRWSWTFNTPEPAAGACWFEGTSQAAPHVAGLAALVVQLF